MHVWWVPVAIPRGTPESITTALVGKAMGVIRLAVPACPNVLSPQQSVDVLVTRHVSTEPDSAIRIAPGNPPSGAATGATTEKGPPLAVPLPSCAASFAPAHATPPSSRSAQVK